MNLKKTLLCFTYFLTVAARPTTDDEVGVEDAQGGLVGALLVVDGGWDDEAKRDAGDALQHDQHYDQHQGALIRHLQTEREVEIRLRQVSQV